MRRIGDAKHHAYARPARDGGDATAAHVVHVVGPDLRVGAPSAEDATAALAGAYGHVLREVMMACRVRSSLLTTKMEQRSNCRVRSSPLHYYLSVRE